MFLIITLCGSIYVRLVLSNFLMLPLIKIGVTFENSHINSSLCFRHSSNSSSCLIIFTLNTILSFWMTILQQKNTILFRMIFVSSVQFSSNRYVIGADEGTWTPTSLTLVPKTSASANSATSAFPIDKNYYNTFTLFLSIEF